MRSTRIYRLGAAVVAVVLGGLLAAHVSAQTGSRAASPQAVISSYYSHVNADFQSGDFSDMATFYAPDAVLTQSAPTGVTKVYRGVAAITGFYQGLYAKLPALHFGLAGQRSLSPSALLRYEAGTISTMKVGPKCAHLFVVKNGMIQTDDWVTYFGGQ